MPYKEFEESSLKFLFDESVWNEIIQFDTHQDYEKMKKHVGNLSISDKDGNVFACGVKGVDFLGIYSGNKLYLIEVKNLKGYMEESEERLKNSGEKLMTEIAFKVKDTLSCIIGGYRTSNKDFWRKVMECILDEKKEIVVVLWLELDKMKASTSTRRSNRAKKSKNAIFDYQQKLRSKLRWIISKRKNVKILNIENYSDDLSLKVSYCEKETDTNDSTL